MRILCAFCQYTYLRKYAIIKMFQRGTERAGDQMEVQNMTDRQAERLEILARLDELDRMKTQTTDQEMQEVIEERKKALREALDKPLST